jgi:hypothetical protein
MASAEAGYISSPSRQSDDSGLKTLTQLVTRDSWTDTRSGMVEDFAGELDKPMNISLPPLGGASC